MWPFRKKPEKHWDLYGEKLRKITSIIQEFQEKQSVLSRGEKEKYMKGFVSMFTEAAKIAPDNTKKNDCLMSADKFRLAVKALQNER